MALPSWMIPLSSKLPLIPYRIPLFEPEWVTTHDALVPFIKQHSSMMNENWLIPLFAVLAYVVCVFGFKHVIAPRTKPLNLRLPLAAWNLSLGLFSALGAIRVIPFFFDIWSAQGAHGSMCSSSAQGLPWYFHTIAGWWTILFCHSKFLELVDTIFIVVRHKKLMFLHWYHHVTVLLFCWASLARHSTYAHAFIGMNFFVHSVMYTYYALRGLGIRPIIPPIAITAIQILQMVLGCAVVLTTGYFAAYAPQGCDVDPLILCAGLLMYGSYLYLFAAFFARRYLSSAKAGQQHSRDGNARPGPAAPEGRKEKTP